MHFIVLSHYNRAYAVKKGKFKSDEELQPKHHSTKLLGKFFLLLKQKHIFFIVVSEEAEICVLWRNRWD